MNTEQCKECGKNVKGTGEFRHCPLGHFPERTEPTAETLFPKIAESYESLTEEKESLRKSVRHYEDRIEEEVYNACEWAATANIVEEEKEQLLKELEELKEEHKRMCDLYMDSQASR